MLKSALIAKLNKVKPKTSKNAVPTKQKKIRNKINNNNGTPHVEIDDCVFDEEILELGEKFNLDPTSVKQGVEGLIKFTSENPKLENKLFDDEPFPIFLQINSLKVPKLHSRIVRIPLKHSMLSLDSDVCLIVPDVKGIPNKKHEEHLEHYEKLLQQRGVDNIKKIMTFHEFRTEYETFELKSRLVELYDVFLVDGRISGKTVSKCGKIFYKKRKVPSAIKLQASKLKEHIELTLKKTPLYLHSKGDSFNVQIGHSKMRTHELVENAFYVIRGLEKDFPGSFANIRSICLNAFRGLTIPIYATMKKQDVVDITTKPKVHLEVVSGELTTRSNAKVFVSSTGEVTLAKINKRKKRIQN